MDAYREYAGNLHMHSVYSDGEAQHSDIVAAAAAAGLDFVIVTDHNIRPQGLEGYHGRTLLLVGEEVHNNQRQPQANHLLVYGTEQEMAPYSFGSSTTLIQSVRDRGGVCYIAHPIEKSSRLRRDLGAIPWVDWPVQHISGIELWNYMSEFKGLLWSNLAALVYSFHPDWGIRGPYRATLRLWDELLSRGQRLGVIGNADAHGTTFSLGPLQRVIFPYVELFQRVNTHILTRGPITGDLAHDKTVVYEALQAGRTWVAYDRPRSTRGFRFEARSGSARAVCGEELKRLGAVSLEVVLPSRGDIRLLRDGTCIKRISGQRLTYTSVEQGIYRVEVHRRYKGLRVGWIYSSPIYVL